MSTSPLDELAAELQQLERSSLLRERSQIDPLPGGRCRRDGREIWNFAANDMLGLADDPRVVEAAMAAMRESGVGSRASPLVTGRTQWHVALEQKLAELKGAEAAVLFPTGYAANLGTITALARRGDVVFCDRLNHASLIDGCRLSGAKLRVYPHRDVAALRRDLLKFADAPRRVIVTDSVFSMDGDLAPLAELATMAVETNSLLVIDEAHATGVFGPAGGGCWQAVQHEHSHAEWMGAAKDHVVCVGTLSKACGAQGGFVTSSRVLCDWLWNTARTAVFSTALSIPVCAAAARAIEIIQAEPERRVWLLRTAEEVRGELQSQGWNIPSGAVGPILPVMCGDAGDVMKLSMMLIEQDVLVAAIRPPTVPRDSSRLRISLSVAHGSQGIAALLRAFSQVRSRC